jgi:hypothetical protein
VNADDQRVLNNGSVPGRLSQHRLCKEYHFADKMRLILETPLPVRSHRQHDFTYYAKTRSAYPGTSLYAGGGRSYQN